MVGPWGGKLGEWTREVVVLRERGDVIAGETKRGRASPDFASVSRFCSYLFFLCCYFFIFFLVVYRAEKNSRLRPPSRVGQWGSPASRLGRACARHTPETALLVVCAATRQSNQAGSFSSFDTKQSGGRRCGDRKSVV